MLVSILHRVTGNAMAFVALPLLLWWIGSLAAGPEAYATFREHMGAWYGMVVLVGLSWTFFEHMASGIRHFVLDIGAGYEIDTNNRWAALVPVAAIALTALFWAAVLLR
jgi:succinate dehydrogenase / fumarate reductase cytochrome b subunit